MNIKKIYCSYYWITSLFALGMSSLQATEEENGKKMITINFWTIKENDQERLLKEEECDEKLAKMILEGKLPSQYCKRSYSVEENSESMPTIVQLVKGLNMPSITSWLDLGLMMVYQTDDEVVVEDTVQLKEGITGFKPFFKIFENSEDIHAVVVSKKGKRTKNINLIIEAGDQRVLGKKLSVYPNTTIDDVVCYIVYDSNIQQERKEFFFDLLAESSYILRYQSNKTMEYAYGSYDMLSTTIEQLDSDEIIFSRPLVTSRFYMQKNQSAISEEDTNTPEKIKQGIEVGWTPTTVNTLKGATLWSIVDKLLPGKSAIDIKFAEVIQNDGEYKILYNKYNNGYCEPMEPNTVNIHRAEVNSDFLLLAYKKENGADIKCLLRKEGDNSIIKEETVYMRDKTYFIEAYLHLLSKANYNIDDTGPATLTYIVSGDRSGANNTSEIKASNISVTSLMLPHSQEKNVTAYIFTMPKDAKLESAEENDNPILSPDTKEPTTLWDILPWLFIVVGITAVGGLVYWNWGQKKYQEEQKDAQTA